MIDGHSFAAIFATYLNAFCEACIPYPKDTKIRGFLSLNSQLLCTMNGHCCMLSQETTSMYALSIKLSVCLVGCHDVQLVLTGLIPDARISTPVSRDYSLFVSYTH